jgi:hypothetical protein
MTGTGPCIALCAVGRKNCAAGCCACVDDSYNTGIYTGPGGPGPRVVSPPPTFKQNVLNGVTFPKFGISGFENVMNGVTAPTLPSVTGVSVDSLKQNVTVPTAPAATAPAASDSSMNWLWILIIIPIGIAAAAMSKSK